MNQRTTLLTATLLGGLSVAIGAFGAHALHDMLVAAGRLDTFETAVRYQYYHVLAMLLIGLLMHPFPLKLLRVAALLFLLGIVFFSGSLYAICLGGSTALGAVTPIGGLLFMAGWVVAFIGVRQGIPVTKKESRSAERDPRE